MDRAESMMTSGVRARAQRYAKAPERFSHVWDESADAVPIGKHRSSAPPSASAEAPAEKVRAENPYRVRESMARTASRRVPKGQTIPPRGSRTAAKGSKQENAAPGAHIPQHKWRNPYADADIPTRGGTLLGEDTMSESERVDAYRRAMRRKLFVKVRRIGGTCLIACLFLVCALLLVYKLFYVVGDITVVGTSLYPPETILEASGVASGDNLYSFSSRVVQESVTLHCPYVRALSVDRKAPNAVHFTVTEDEAVFCAYIYGELRALSPTLRVLDAVDADTAAQQGLIRLCLPAVDKAVAGRVVALENVRSERIIREITAAVLASTLSDRITAVDLREPHSLRMICDGQYLLLFGDTKDVGMKLKIADAVMADELFSSAIKAQIDLSDTGETSVVLDDQTDLSW